VSASPADAPGVAITEVAAAGPQLETVRELLLEYGQQSDAAKLCFQGFDQEVATLPGAYAPPAGCLLLAELGGVPAGCIALRPLGGKRCEMKRLYVRAVFRGAGLAGVLVERLIEKARALGYQEMFLDTLPEMRAARLLYDMLGFVPCRPYLPEPTPGADCLALNLTLPSRT
jgi:GNAT superfamily N-acetyltransferase